MNKEDLTNLVVEAVNARNPGLIDDLDIPEPQLITDRLETIQERWPRLMMTRGDVEDRPVAVVWMPDAEEAYRPVAHIEVTLDGDDPYMTLVEGTDPNLVAEEPANRRVAEWESSGEMLGDRSNWI